MLYCHSCKHLVKSTRTEQEQGGSIFHCTECGAEIPIRDGLHPGDIIAGFEIIREIGRGAMGIVYEARQINLERRVAVKILSEEIACDEVYVERFFREARSAASMPHPNIVQAYDAGVTDNGIYYFVMELIHGENLNQILNREGRVPFSKSGKYFLSIAGALSSAWTRNTLSHGDIKPENIIVQPDGKAKLADFGLARRSKDKEIENEDIRATPAYAPPEIIQGTKGVPGFKSDMYSFGATMYHVLTGREPFPGDDPQLVCNMQISAQQISASKISPDVPAAISTLIDDLMEKSPDQRPATWADVEDRLAEMFLHGSSKKQLHAEGLHKGHAAVGKRMPLIIALSVVLVLVVIAAAIGLKYARKQDPGQQQVIETNAEAKDAESFKARWSILKSKFPKGEPPLQELREFVQSAGDAAPDEAVKMLHELEKKQDSAKNALKKENLDDESNFLQERNALLDEAELFIGGQDQSDYTVEELEDLELAVLRRFAQLKTASTTQKDLLLTNEQKELINSYLDVINAKIDEIENGFEDEDIEIEPADAGKTGTDSKEPAKSDTDKKTDSEKKTDSAATATIGSAESAKTDTKKTTARRRKMITTIGADGKITYRYEYEDEEDVPEIDDLELSASEQLWQSEMQKLPKLVGTSTTLLESRNEAVSNIQDLIKLADLPDDKVTLGNSIIRFIQLAKNDLLSYISASKKVLKGQELFRNSNPGSKLDDLVGKELRMKFTDKETGATLSQKLNWETVKKSEREERIALNLVRLSVFRQLPEEFREVLFSKLILSGMSIDSAVKLYRQSSGLSKETLNRLELVAEQFRKIEVPEIEVEPVETELEEDTSASTATNVTKNEPLLKNGSRTREQIEADREERALQRAEREAARQERLEQLERAVERTVRNVRTRTNTRGGGGRR